MPREINRAVLEAGILVMVEIAREDAGSAFLIAKGFVRAAERVANGKPLTDPSRPETANQAIEAVADGFLKLLPGLHAVDPPDPAAKA